MKMMTAISETEEGPSLWGMGVVAITLCVRVLHSLAQKELSFTVLEALPSTSPAFLAFFVAAIQTAAAVGTFRINNLHLTTSTAHREAAIIGGCAYAAGLYLSNYLLWSDDTGATACFGVQEPALCMLLLYLAPRISTETNRAAAVVGICLGAALLTGNVTLLGGVYAILKLISSVFCLVRNMVVKHLYDSDITFHVRSQNVLLAMVGGGTVGAVLLAVIVGSGSDLLVGALMLVVCGVLSVTLLHLLLTVLSLYDTLTVAVFMVWAQVLENVVLVSQGASFRPWLLAVLLGAALFAGGHYGYFKDGLEAGAVHLNIKQVGVNDLFNRLQYILYSAVVLGLLAVLLQPYVSQGDVLSLVGLDNIV